MTQHHTEPGQPGGPGTAGLVGALIPGYGHLHLPTPAEVGGEEALFSEATGPDRFTSAVIACAWWADLSDHAVASDAIGRALADFHIQELIAFNDIALAAPNALPDLATTLASTWRSISESDTSTRGNVALEAWTRLAIGGWTSTLPLRGALDTRCEHASRAAAAADIFLVRSVGAALDQWADHDLRASLERLAGIEDVECDVAFELAMSHLRAGVESGEPTAAAAHLDLAATMLDHANLEGDRPDAVAFNVACKAVAAFLRQQPVPAGSAEAIENAVGHWYLGYLNETPHWRQARAQTGAAWSALVIDLETVTAVDERTWLEPLKLLADIGRIYVSHHSSTLLADPRLQPADLEFPAPPGPAAGPGDRVGVPIAIGPRLDAALAATAARVDLVDKWLASASSHMPDLPTDVLDAVAAARERIRESPPGGKGDASRDAELPDGIREALADKLDPDTYNQVTVLLEPFLAETTAMLEQAAPRPITTGYRALQENLVLTRLHKQLRVVLPEEHTQWVGPLDVVLTALARVTAIAIDHTQGGERRLPWHGDIDDGGKPPEHRLADYVAQSIQLLTGIHTHVEIPNIGGGRADVIIPVNGEEFVIEVKRTTAVRTNEQLTDEYADQAAQYTHTRTPFAFLAVLDLTRHETRIGLDASFWVSEWTDGAVTRALIGLRVLADVAPPSDLS